MGLIIEQQGFNLVMNVNGDRLIFYPATGGTWINATAGELRIIEVGTSLMIRTPESHIWAYPTHTGVWVATASFDPDPGPEPGEGEFAWPYEPTPGHWVTSEYGPRSGRFHEGMDFSGGPAVFGEPIPAIGPGYVQQSGLNGAFGYSVIIHHGTMDGYDWKSLYAHMPSAAPRPGVGDTISKGDIIGQVNNTGSSFGSHLHLEIHRCSIGGSMRWDNLNPSYSSPRTGYQPRNFFAVYGDGTWLIS